MNFKCNKQCLFLVSNIFYSILTNNQQWSMINTQEETHLFKNKFCYLVVQIKIVLSIENDNLFLYFYHEVHFTDYALSCMKGCSKHSLREILLTGSRTWILSRKSRNWETFLIWSSGNLLPPTNIPLLIWKLFHI